MQEFAIIKKYFLPLTNNCQESNLLLDDCAKLSLKSDEELLISKDIFVENIHFLASDLPAQIAKKLLVTNISDIASCGGKPLFYCLGFSKNCNESFIKNFTQGLKSIQDEYSISLIGGDTVSSQNKFFSITIFGAIKKNHALLRQNAKEGDLIFVSGNIGDAFIGLQSRLGKLKISNKKTKNYFLQRHFLPQAQVKLGRELVAQKLSKCATDISDGLFSDLRNICNAANVGAEIYFDKIPISQNAKNLLAKEKSLSKLDLASGGDDYELIFTAKNEKKIFALAKKLNLNLTCIGKIIKTPKSSKIRLIDQNNKSINIKKFGYEH